MDHLKFGTLRLRIIAIALFALSLTFATSACSEAVDTENAYAADGEDDSFFSGGRADHLGGFEEGSLAAQGILRIVNTYTFDELDALIDVRAARSIIAYRSGPDGILGSADDRLIYSLEVLDSISWVGPRAVEQLYNHMIAEGLQPSDEDLVHGFREGGPAAIGILFVVNTRSFEELDALIDVRGAQGIVDYREQPNQGEPRLFQSLRELDGIPYVSATAFAILHGYASEQGYISASFPSEDPEPGEENPLLREVELIGEAAERSAYFSSVSEHSYRWALDGYRVIRDDVSLEDVVSAVMELDDFVNSDFHTIVYEEAHEFSARNIDTVEATEAVEATYGTDYTVGYLQGTFPAEDSEYVDWYQDIVVYYYGAQDLAVVFTDEFIW